MDGLDPGAARLIRIEKRTGTVEENLASVGNMHADQTADQGGLAGTVVADDRGHLAPPCPEVNVLKARTPPKFFSMPVQARIASDGASVIAGSA